MGWYKHWSTVVYSALKSRQPAILANCSMNHYLRLTSVGVYVCVSKHAFRRQLLQRPASPCNNVFQKAHKPLIPILFLTYIIYALSERHGYSESFSRSVLYITQTFFFILFIFFYYLLSSLPVIIKWDFWMNNRRHVLEIWSQSQIPLSDRNLRYKELWNTWKDVKVLVLMSSSPKIFLLVQRL